MSIFKLRAGGDTNVPPLPIDEQETRRALALLPDPAYGLELTGPPLWGLPHVARANNIENLWATVQAMANRERIYVRINPVAANATTCATDRTIVYRRWLFIDIDPCKPDECKDDPATDAEHEAARELAEDVRTYLSEECGWPAPMLVDSGNGWYLLYRVHLPNDAHAKSVVKAFTHGLSKRFSDERGVIDPAVYNAGRLMKLPGTLARKGTASAGRPFRPCRIVFVPHEQHVVSVEEIQAATPLAVAPSAPAAAPPPQQSPFLLKAGSSSGDAYFQRALDNECARVALCPRGDRNNALNRAAFAIGTLIGAGLGGRATAEARLREAARQCGLLDDPGCGASGVEATLRSGLEAGIAQPRVAPDRNATSAQRHSEGESASDNAPAGESIIIRASKIEPRRVEWLWPGRIPLGKLTTFAGVGGLGKTFVLCDIAARVTRGLEWPYCAECARPGQVLFVSGEDDPDDTLVPRMIELGADLDRVCFLRTEVLDCFTLADLKTLDTALAHIGPEVRLVVVDPPTAYLGGVDDHKNAELRRLLSPLKAWASKHRLSMIFNTHVNKSSARVEALMRVMGSVAWVNTVRAAHLFVRDPGDNERRLFLGMKLNIGKEQKGLAYRIVDSGNDMARVEWLGTVDTTADEAMNRGESKTRKVKASEWLIERFREKLEWSSEELFREGRQDDIHRRAIFEAKALLDLPRAKKVGSEFVWWVPADWPLLRRDEGEITES